MKHVSSLDNAQESTKHKGREAWKHVLTITSIASLIVKGTEIQAPVAIVYMRASLFRPILSTTLSLAKHSNRMGIHSVITTTFRRFNKPSNTKESSLIRSSKTLHEFFRLCTGPPSSTKLILDIENIIWLFSKSRSRALVQVVSKTYHDSGGNHQQ